MSRNSPKAYLATIYHIVYQEMVGLFEGIINEAFVLRNYSPGYYSNAHLAFHNIFAIGNNYFVFRNKRNCNSWDIPRLYNLSCIVPCCFCIRIAIMKFSTFFLAEDKSSQQIRTCFSFCIWSSVGKYWVHLRGKDNNSHTT